MPTTGIDNCKSHMQGKGPWRAPAPDNRGGAGIVRPSQASTLTQPCEISLLISFNCTGCSMVGVWCMCQVSGESKYGRTGWEVNGVHNIRQRKTGKLEVNFLITACECDSATVLPRWKHATTTWLLSPGSNLTLLQLHRVA